MTFASLGLIEPLLRSLETLGYQTPTPVQAQAIPAVLAGRDLMAAAQTGTGKTAGFALPLLQLLAMEGPKVTANSVRALIFFLRYPNDFRHSWPDRTLAARP